MVIYNIEDIYYPYIQTILYGNSIVYCKISDLYPGIIYVSEGNLGLSIINVT